MTAEKTKWKCKICRQEHNKNIVACPNCNVTRKEQKLIWICPVYNKATGEACRTPNIIKSKKCRTCGALKKRKVAEAELMTKHELIKKIKDIQNDTHRAFFALLYLTGARVSELLSTLKLKNFDIQKISGRDFLIVANIPTLKRREAAPRTIPINMEIEYDLVNCIVRYLEFREPTHILFPYKRRYMYNLSIRYFGKQISPHYFRHLRNTHLAADYGLDGFHLKQFNNWASVKSADFYIHLNPKDLAKRMV